MAIGRGDEQRWAEIARQRRVALRLGAPTTAAPEAVVAALTAMQSQEPRYARWSVARRTASPSADAVDRAIDAGAILRTHILRPTWHYVTPADLSWLLPLSGPRVDMTNGSMYRQAGLDTGTFDRSEAIIAATVAEAPATRRELTDALAGTGISTTGERGTYMIMHAELIGLICSGPLRNGQHTYVPYDQRVPPTPTLSREEALARLARRYFSTRGPATVADLAWWSGSTLTDARNAQDAVRDELESEEFAGQTLWHAAHGTRDGSSRPDTPAGDTQVEVEGVPRNAIDLLGCFDELVVSYRPPRLALAHPDADLSPLERIAGFSQTITLDGRMIGRWGLTPKSVEARLAVALGRAEHGVLMRALRDLAGFYGVAVSEPTSV